MLGLATALVSVAAALPVGHSVEGRTLRPIVLGAAPPAHRLLVVGCIHGNEPAGLPIAHALVRAGRVPGAEIVVLPAANPDGCFGTGTRQNAHGVDLNRNFPWRWRPMSGVYASGSRPLSDREARIAHRLILRLHPYLTVWFHQHLDLVWASGGDRRFEKMFARVSGLPYHPMPQLAGSAISWQNNTLHGTTAFAAELPAGRPDAAQVALYVRAVLAAARIR